MSTVISMAVFSISVTSTSMIAMQRRMNSVREMFRTEAQDKGSQCREKMVAHMPLRLDRIDDAFDRQVRALHP